MFLLLGKQFQRIVAVIDKVETAATGNDSQAEETTSSRRATRSNRLIQEFVVDLSAARRYFDYSTVVAIDDQDIAVGRNSQPQRIVNETIGTYIISSMS